MVNLVFNEPDIVQFRNILHRINRDNAPVNPVDNNLLTKVVFISVPLDSQSDGCIQNKTVYGQNFQTLV